MSESSLLSVSAGDLSVTTKQDGDTITVFCIGTADMRVGDALDGILTKVHEVALQRTADQQRARARSGEEIRNPLLVQARAALAAEEPARAALLRHGRHHH
jgi:hypothetical protein